MTAIDDWCAAHGASEAARWEMERVVERGLAAHVTGGVVLEIGAHRGDSLRVWIEEFAPCLAIAVEREVSDRTVKSIMHLDAVTLFGDSTKPETYHRVVDELGGMPVDFLYIDGDHEFVSALTDWSLYGSLVRPGGLVVFDDAETEAGVVEVTAHLGGDLIKGDGDSGGKYVLVR